jgi:YD repeat-containing protein
VAIWIHSATIYWCADPANGLARSDTQFDLLGRAIRQFLAARPNADGDLYRPEIDQVFDRWGNIVEQTAPYDPHATGGLNGQVVATYFVYNDQNKVIEQIQPNAAGVTALPADAAPVLTDTLWGTGGADVIDSRGQAHLIIGNGGGDTIVYNAGYGALTIDEVPDNSGGATLALGAGIDPSQVAVSVSGNDLVLTLSPTDVITLVDADRDAVGQWGVQSVTFADAPGTTWTAAELLAKATDAAPTMSGTVVDGTLTYQYAAGEGARVIDSVGYATLDLSGVSPGQVGLSTDGAELVLRLSPTDVITITEGYVGSESMSYAQFGVGLVNFNGGAGVAGGTSWTLQQMRAMLQTASPANRTLYGTPQGGDVFTYNSGAGAVTIQNSNTDGQTGVLRLGAGITPSSVVVSASPDGQDLVLKLSATDSVTIAFGYSGHDSVWYAGYGVAQVQFADGATWSLAQLKALAQQAAPGNTALFGADANTRYSYAAGDGAVSIGDLTGSSTLTFASGIEPGQVSVSSPNGVDLVLALSATDIITIPYGYSGNDSVYAAGFGVANVTFADIPGTSWSLATLRAMAAANPTSFGAHATLGGSQPGAGPQTYSYAAGAGAVTLTDSTAPGLLQLGAGINPWDLGVSSNGTDLIVRVSATDSVTIAGGMIGGTDLRNIRFADGYVLGLAQLQSMALTATAANTTLNGPPTGGASFAYNQGAGAATINLVWTNWSAATLQLNGILPAGAEISSPNGQDLVLSFSATDSITIPSGYNELAQGRGIETITFADGTVWNAAHIEALLTGAVLAAPGPAGAAAATAASAAGADLSPVTRVAYDADGEQIATTDADGNTTGQIWNADGELAEVTHADSGKITYDYDAFGDQVATTDAMGNTTQYAYDGLGRQVSIVNLDVMTMESVVDAPAAANIETVMTYDQLGNKLTQEVGTETGGSLTAFAPTMADGSTRPDLTSYEYDLRGNIVQTTDADGNITRNSFDDQGKQSGETDADGNTESWVYNAFGQLQSQTDLGGRQTAYHYDAAGRLTSSAAEATTLQAADTKTYTYDGAGDLLQLVDDGAGLVLGDPGDSLTSSTETSTYRYDASGRQVFEETSLNGTDYQNEDLKYDALGRLSEIDDNFGLQNVLYGYDAMGNKISETIEQPAASETLYYAYDEMNRVIMADSTVAYDQEGGEANWNLGLQAHLLSYDLNGNRTSDTYWATPQHNADGTTYGGQVEWLLQPGPNGPNAPLVGVWTENAGVVEDFYGYDALNRLSEASVQYVSASTQVNHGQPVFDTNRADAIPLDVRYYDAASWQVEQGPSLVVSLPNGQGSLNQGYLQALNGSNSDAEGSTLTLSSYDADGRVLHQTITDELAGSTSQTSYTFQASDGTTESDYDGVGNLQGYTQTSGSGSSALTTTYTIGFDRLGGYEEASILAVQSGSASNQGASNDYYDADGNLVQVTEDGSAQSEDARSLVDDVAGEVLQKAQDGNVLNQLIAAGAVVGTYGTGVDPNNPSTPGNPPAPNFTVQDDFDPQYEPVTSSSPAAAIGNYQVQAGDTLESIAQTAYGDGSLWYLIAQANGLSSDDDLHVDEILNIPTVVGDAHDSATTVAPYDPSRIIGSTTPNLPTPVPPPAANGGQGCGGIGEVIMLVVAAVVSVYLGPEVFLAVEGALGPVAGAIVAGAVAGAAGSIVSQGVGNLLGVENGFSWSQVGLAALGGAIGGGLNGIEMPDAANPGGFAPQGGLGLSTQIGGTPGLIVGAMVADAATQGIAVATGLQKSFSWAEVAGAGVGAGVTSGLSQAIGMHLGSVFANGLASGTLGGIAGGLTAAAAQGGNVNAANIALDSFGNALGSSLANEDWSGGNSNASSQTATTSSDRSSAWNAVVSGQDQLPVSEQIQDVPISVPEATYADLDPGPPVDLSKLVPSLNGGSSAANFTTGGVSGVFGQSQQAFNSQANASFNSLVNGTNGTLAEADALQAAPAPPAGHQMLAFSGIPSDPAGQAQMMAVLNYYNSSAAPAGEDDLFDPETGLSSRDGQAAANSVGNFVIPRLGGVAQIVGGGGEILGSSALFGAGFGAEGTVVGVPVGVAMQGVAIVGLVDGSDHVATGISQAWNGAPQKTGFVTLAGNVAGWSGASPDTIQEVSQWAAGTQNAFGVVVGASGSYAALTAPAGPGILTVAELPATNPGAYTANAPWLDNVTNFQPGGTFLQCGNGSCVAATGQVLTNGALTEQQLVAQIGEWSNPQALAGALNQAEPGANIPWKGFYLGSEEDALAVANSGPAGAVLQAPLTPSHMVTIAPVIESPGNFLVYDTGAGATYQVTSSWVRQYVTGGVWK